jgi:small subunit ribosomal protein S6
VSRLRLYDVMLIVDPRLADEEVAQLGTRLQETLTGLGAEIVTAENWGKRRLSFELRKQREGHYLLFQTKATPAVVREYERQLKLNEAVFRFMTTRVVERRRQAAPEAAAEAPAEAAASPAATVPNEVG